MGISFNDDSGISYKIISWTQLGQVLIKLSQQILNKENQGFDRLIMLASGGLTMGRALKDYLNIGKIASLQISFYTGINKCRSSPIIIQSVPIDLSNERVLVFDDINDTGATLNAAVDYVKLRGAVKIKTATLFQKPHTKYPSDYFGQVSQDWLIFPDEIRETIDLLTKRWRKNLSLAQIKDRLKQIGFNQREIDLFLSSDQNA